MNGVLGVRAAGVAFEGTASETKKSGAGRDFEALLIAQMLRSAREGGDEASNAAMEFAEQQLASVIASSGGLGIGSLVMKGLDAPDQKPAA
jgi:Rod binding domain-containing protein